MKNLQQGQIPGWVCWCQVGIQGFVLWHRVWWVLAGAAGTAWVWSLLQQGSFSAREDPWAIKNRNSGHVLMNSCWSSPGRVNAKAVKCKKRKKEKKALVSWDKAFCSRGKANEIISVTQDLVRTFCIYGVDSVLPVHSLFSLWELQTLGCRPVGIGTGFPSSSPTTSGNLLTTFCESLEIKHAAVVTNPQTQRLHFRNDWCVWVVSYFFLTESDDFAQQWKQRSAQRSQAKGLLPVGCCLSAPVPGGQGCGAVRRCWTWLCSEILCWGPGVCEHHWFPLSGFSLLKFILHDLNAERVLQPKAAGQGRSCLVRGILAAPAMGFEGFSCPRGPGGSSSSTRQTPPALRGASAVHHVKPGCWVLCLGPLAVRGRISSRPPWGHIESLKCSFMFLIVWPNLCVLKKYREV